MEQLKKVRKSGLTFAPEAGSQRLRNVINKNLTEEQILSACKIAFYGGYSQVKLYFMLGLPDETDEDLKDIIRLSEKITELFYNNPDRQAKKCGRLKISISCATFVPKPFTPFEFEPQATEEEIKHKQHILLKTADGHRTIGISYHHYETSILEAVLARGDRRLSTVIYNAWQKGCKFDSWDEYFDYEKWKEAFSECNIQPEFYANRKREYNEIMPWDHLDYLVSKKFLINENKKAHNAETTPCCREKCSGCGVNIKTGCECFGR